jgi:tetratricopeptide (TPR) repeat protein
MSVDERNWIVRGADGRIFGPYSTKKIWRQIEKGFFSGAEFVSLYPGGDWQPISKTNEFYDKLLEVLASESGSGQGERQDRDADGSLDETDPSEKIKTVGRGRSVRDSSAKASEPIRKPIAAPKNQFETKTMQIPPPAVIELQDLQAAPRKPRRGLALIPISMGLVALLILGSAVLFSPKAESEKIHLLLPRKSSADLSAEQVKQKFKKATEAFQQDTFEGYVSAQNSLVELVEGSGKNPDALSFLCLVYRELWPFAYQDSKDLATVGSVAQRAKELDSTGFNGATCEIIRLGVNGHFSEARSLTNTWIQKVPNAPVLFDLKGETFAAAKDYTQAAAYYEQVRVLWPQWMKGYIQQARALTQIRQNSKALELYHQVLQAWPGHSVAKIETGLIEYKQFEHYDQALSLIRAGMDSGNRLPHFVQARGFFGLAEIYLQRNQRAKALENAKNAYALNSSNPEIRDFIIRLGGVETLRKTKVESRELMYLGDQYVKTGDCIAAQAEYKAAFENDEKNGAAAMKAGQCLWQLNQTSEAIDWLNKAIQADRKLTAAYVTLADYQSQRFDFLSAARTLQAVQLLSNNNYEVYRGFALIELRRNNFKDAVAFAEHSLKLYEGDVSTYTLIAQAHLALGNYGEAQRYISRAIEIDIDSVEAQCLNAKLLAATRGADAAVSYLQDFIAHFDRIIEYRTTLGEVLMQEERYAQAEDVFREIRSLDPKNKSALLSLGKTQQNLNRNQDALQSYLSAAVLDPSDATPIFLAGLLYMQQGKMPQALTQFQRVLNINPRYPKAHYQLGRVELKMGNPQGALQESTNEKQINPDLPDAYILAAEAQSSLKQYSACAAEYQKAVSKQPQGADVYVKMAHCYRQSGALDSAVSLLREALAKESGNPNVYRELGAIYQTKGMADEALQAYNMYMTLNPSARDREKVQQEMRNVENGDFQLKEDF